MHELERAMYLNENTKRIFEIGSKVKKLWDAKHVYRWSLCNIFFFILTKTCPAPLKYKSFNIKAIKWF